jgi:adenylate kinase
LKNNWVIVVTGTPGTGKTRFARLLGKKIGIDSVNLTKFAKQCGLIKCYDHKRRTYVVNEHALAHSLARYLTTLKKRVLVEGHYSGRLVPSRFTEVVFVLRCDPEILKMRLKKRGYSNQKIKENVEAEVLDICLSEAIASQGLEKVAELDTSLRTIKSSVEEALRILNRKEPRQIARCDWLTELENRGKLDRFLKEQAVDWKRRLS